MKSFQLNLSNNSVYRFLGADIEYFSLYVWMKLSDEVCISAKVLQSV